MAPPFRAEQVGSFIRPKSLLEARKSSHIYDDGLSDDLAAATQAAITTAVQKQIDLDIQPITTGEYERTVFYSGFFECLRGMEKREHCRIPEDFHPGLPTLKGLMDVGMREYTAVIASGKIEHAAPAYLEAWNMLKKAAPEEHWKNCKLAIPAMTWQHIQLAKGLAYTSEAYQSDGDYFADLAAACRAEYHALYDAGLRHIQIDEPQLLFFVLDSFRDGLKQEGYDPDELLDLYIWAHNKSIQDRPKDLHMGIHLCRGNMPGVNAGFFEGSYERIAEKLLQELDYDTFYLEFDDARSGSFEPLRFLPKGKNVILGLVSTKKPDLEDLHTIESRVHEAAAAIAKGQGRSAEEVIADSLGVSPQCGFASMSFGRNVGSEERMWDKLVLVRDVARKVWKDAN